RSLREAKCMMRSTPSVRSRSCAPMTRLLGDGGRRRVFTTKIGIGGRAPDRKILARERAALCKFRQHDAGRAGRWVWPIGIFICSTHSLECSRPASIDVDFAGRSAKDRLHDDAALKGDRVSSAIASLPDVKGNMAETGYPKSLVH